MREGRSALIANSYHLLLCGSMDRSEAVRARSQETRARPASQGYFDASSGSAEVQPCCARPHGENQVPPHAQATDQDSWPRGRRRFQ